MSKISELLNEPEKCSCEPACSCGCAHQSEEKVCSEETAPDMVNHPKQYRMDDMTYEPIKVIHAWGSNFNIGNAIKYLARYQKKWNPIEDLKKAIFYIQDEINHLENDKKVKENI